jgi:hypothetical protein
MEALLQQRYRDKKAEIDLVKAEEEVRAKYYKDKSYAANVYAQKLRMLLRATEFSPMMSSFIDRDIDPLIEWRSRPEDVPIKSRARYADMWSAVFRTSKGVQAAERKGISIYYLDNSVDVSRFLSRAPHSFLGNIADGDWRLRVSRWNSGDADVNGRKKREEETLLRASDAGVAPRVGAMATLTAHETTVSVVALKSYSKIADFFRTSREDRIARTSAALSKMHSSGISLNGEFTRSSLVASGETEFNGQLPKIDNVFIVEFFNAVPINDEAKRNDFKTAKEMEYYEDEFKRTHKTGNNFHVLIEHDDG